MADKVIYTANDEPRDVIGVEFGDTKQTDFYPQSKVMRWDNEVNFSLRYADSDPSGAVVSTGEKTATYVDGDITVKTYDKPELEEGGTEFEVILASAPASNIIPFTVRSKSVSVAQNLPFTEQDLTNQPFYTEDLVITENEVKGQDDFVHLSMAPEAVNSYVLYHNGNPINYEGGTLYKTGKFLTLYRPKAVDDNGVETWCDHVLDLEAETYTIIVPQSFLDTAAYPVTIDPTMGNTGIGVNTMFVGGGENRGITVIPPVNARVASYSFYLSAITNNDTTRASLWANCGNASALETLVTGTDDANPGWITRTSVVKPHLQAGVQYIYACGYDQVDGVANTAIFWDAMPGGSGLYSYRGGGIAPTWFTYQSGIYFSMYLTYSEVYHNGYGYRRTISTDPTKVDADLTNYPMLVSGTYAYLKTVANGGLVEHASGFDIRFETTDGIKLDHEIESWDATTGAIVAWVRLPSVSNTVSTQFYLYYGKTGMTVTEANPTGVWSSTYKAVWHLNTLSDSTSNANTITNYGVTLNVAGGKIGNAADFETSETDYMEVADSASLDTIGAFTISCWVKAETTAYGGLYYKGLAQQWEGAVTKTIDFGFFPGNFVIGIANGATNYAGKTSGFGPTVGTWYHFVATWDGLSNAGLNLYVNGVKSTVPLVEDVGNVTAIPANTYTVILGGQNKAGGTQYRLDGLLEELRLQWTERPEAWVKTEYNNQNDPSTFYTVGSQETPVEVAGSYSWRRKITINSSQVAATATNFAVWFSTTQNSLKSVANGGNVVYADGRDIIFSSTDDPTGTSRMDFEKIYYDPVLGTFKAWVRVPSLSSSVNTIIWLFYGNSTLLHIKQNQRKTWMGYQEVFHMDVAPTYTIGGAREDGQLAAARGGQTSGTETPVLDTVNYKLHNSWDFNGSNRRVFIMDTFFNSTPTPVTVTAWVRTAINNVAQSVYTKGINAIGGTDYHDFGVTNTNRLRIRANGADQLTGTTVLSINTWHYVVFVLGNTGIYSIYLNGVLDGTDTGNPTSWSLDADKEVTFGTKQNNNNNWRGQMEEVRWYFGVLPGTFIQTEYNNQNSPNTFYTLGDHEPGAGGGGWVIFGDEGLIA
jgi:hypothetical protein